MKILAPAPILVSAALAVGGCGPVDPVATSPTNNPSVEVEELLTHEGCTVYRFRDSGSPSLLLGKGQYHYYVHCRDAPATGSPAGVTSRVQPVSTDVTLGPVSCGKACTRDEEIPTVSR